MPGERSKDINMILVSREVRGKNCVVTSFKYLLIKIAIENVEKALIKKYGKLRFFNREEALDILFEKYSLIFNLGSKG